VDERICSLIVFVPVDQLGQAACNSATFLGMADRMAAGVN